MGAQHSLDSTVLLDKASTVFSGEHSSLQGHTALPIFESTGLVENGMPSWKDQLCMVLKALILIANLGFLLPENGSDEVFQAKEYCDFPCVWF